jgi:predicted dehydrogenase
MATAHVLFVGGTGHHYLSRLVASGRVTGELLVDPTDAEASHQRAKTIGVPAAEGELADAVEHVDPDVISVGTTYSRNGRYVLEALQTDLPIVSDKPVAVDRATLDAVGAAVSISTRLISEFDRRARRHFRAAREVVRSGEIGDVALAVGQMSYKFGTRPDWYGDESVYCGTLQWVGSHMLDLIDFVLSDDRPLQVLHAAGGNVAKPELRPAMEDHVTATLRLPDGGTGIVHADFLNPPGSPRHDQDRLRVVGSRGQVVVEDERCLLTTDGPLRDVTERGEPAASVEERLLAAAVGEKDPDFNTAASLRSAALLVEARELQRAT